jgi:uncharacterized lipoprotein YddW (UPF0748 family)
MKNRKYYYFMLYFALIFLTGCSSSRLTLNKAGGMNPKREFRGVWIQTVYQSEYKDMKPDQMRADFVRKLNYLRACGINAVLFQVRPEADAFYNSPLEPWSRFFTGVQGLAPEGDFDLMQFLIEECHKRNMEFHAWLNPYRAGASGSNDFAPSHIMYTHPGRFVKYDDLIYFDPGQPQNRKFICTVVEDIVRRYDVDGIHLDDYFYPYPVSGVPFPDDRSFNRFGKEAGFTEETRGDWRRQNVNSLIREMYEAIHAVKPWVRFGISPFGIYRNAGSTPDASGSFTNGLQSYDDLYTDVLLWAREGWIDYVIPQLYWEIGHQAADYANLVNWWNNHSEGRHLYVGQDVARTMKAGQLTTKMSYERVLPHISGNCFWPANEILWNNTGVGDSLRTHYHRYPALLPSYSHQNRHAPGKVKDLSAEFSPDGVLFRWNAQLTSDPADARYFVVYVFPEKGKMDINDPSRILALTSRTSYTLPYNRLKGNLRIVVTAVNRFHNESGKTQIKIKL